MKKTSSIGMWRYLCRAFKNLIDWNVEVLVPSLQKQVAMGQDLDVIRRNLRRSSIGPAQVHDGAPVGELTDITRLLNSAASLTDTIEEQTF
jgi:hypothetical protein